MSTEDPRVRAILNKRTQIARAHTNEVIEAVKSDAMVRSGPDSRPPVDLRSIENTVVLERVNEIGNSLVSVEKELHTLSTIFKVVLGVGVVGLLGVLWGVLRMAGRI